MKNKIFLSTAFFLLVCSFNGAGESSVNWTGFRGGGNSTTQIDGLPLKWSEDQITGWETNLQGRGQSSPVVYENKVFVSSVEGPKKERLIMSALDVFTGEILWNESVEATATREVTDYISFASPTPVVDSKCVYSLYEEGDFLAWDHSGNLKWRVSLSQEFGQPEGNHGQGSSPVLTEHGLVVLMDHEGASWIGCFDKECGKLKWKTPRNTQTAWSTPTLIHWKGQQALLASGSGTLTVYSSLDGSVLGSSSQELEGNNVPSPTISGDWVVIGARKRGSNMAFKLEENAEGNPEFVPQWEARKATSTFGSPLIHEGRAYIVSAAGIVYAYQLETGNPLFEERIKSSTWASPLSAPGRIYFFGADGTTTILAPSDTMDIIALNSLPIGEKDKVYGYAVTDSGFVVRTESALRAIFNP